MTDSRLRSALAALFLASCIPLAARSADAPAPKAWLDRATLPRWNQADAPVPSAPASRASDDAGRCDSGIRKPTSAEDKRVVAAGWKLVGAYLRYDGTAIVRGAAGFDGMCRWAGYQAFVFVDGSFAGTLAPAAMDSRSDGALEDLHLYSARDIVATFVRYSPSDPLCCPTRTSSATYLLERGPHGSAVVPTAVTTEANPSR